MISFHNGFWSGVLVALPCGIILGWMFWGLPVLAKRYMMKRTRANVEEIRRILAFKSTPERTIQEISQDRPHVPNGQYQPRHLEPPNETIWTMFRDDPRHWLLNRMPKPRTPTTVAEQTYKELTWSTRADTSGGVKSTRSDSGEPAKTPAPWLGNIMVLVRTPTPVTSSPGVTTLVASGMRSSTAT